MKSKNCLGETSNIYGEQSSRYIEYESKVKKSKKDHLPLLKIVTNNYKNYSWTKIRE